jgi:hypothetical protein
MTLDNEDIQAIATEVVRQMRRLDQIHVDQRYEASLPLSEQKRLSRIRMAQCKAEMKMRRAA